MINFSPAIGLVGNREFVLEVHVDWVSSDRLIERRQWLWWRSLYHKNSWNVQHICPLLFANDQ
ncbi:hypothetical protein ACF3DV_25045 [Chlorogloeopsis fritschii PCC 9212]|uniref:Uncharacterized protein n=1 Tax=Chlorogloeopsis fritschii PCC 6912 TaxID=211165 RepID=A0A3S0XPA9_CHLFR|nr:hypothetical protein [Chlorogloeopsis fritschii]RUR73887.1 hypothetical protein PCC6912_54280 [Chlorogloeopsis fritschii PCC 6912]